MSDVTVDDTTKLSELLKNAKSGEHIGMKINGVCFDLNIFNQLYCFFAPQNEDEKLPGVDLTIGEEKKLISKGGFPEEIMSESKKYTFLLYNRVTAK